MIGVVMTSILVDLDDLDKFDKLDNDPDVLVTTAEIVILGIVSDEEDDEIGYINVYVSSWVNDDDDDDNDEELISDLVFGDDDVNTIVGSLPNIPVRSANDRGRG
jgi:hypothetical protein